VVLKPSANLVSFSSAWCKKDTFSTASHCQSHPLTVSSSDLKWKAMDSNKKKIGVRSGELNVYA
jgi:hypothetical protein